MKGLSDMAIGRLDAEIVELKESMDEKFTNLGETVTEF